MYNTKSYIPLCEILHGYLCSTVQIHQCDERLLAIKVTDYVQSSQKSGRFYTLERYLVLLKFKLLGFRFRVLGFRDNTSCASTYQFYEHAYAGAELRNWLLFFSLPVLCGVLPSQFLDHLALVVCAIFIYSSESISEQDFLTGNYLLKQFHKEFSSLYGELFILVPQCIYVA